MEDRLASGDFRFAWKNIKNWDVTVIRRYSGSDYSYLNIDNKQADSIMASSKKVVDAALNKAEVKARQMQETDRWNRQVLASAIPIEELGFPNPKTPADRIRQLMQFPKLARYEVVMTDENSDIETLLLDKVVRAFRRNPDAQGSALIAAWYGTPEGDLLQRIVS